MRPDPALRLARRYPTAAAPAVNGSMFAGVVIQAAASKQSVGLFFACREVQRAQRPCRLVYSSLASCVAGRQKDKRQESRISTMRASVTMT